MNPLFFAQILPADSAAGSELKEAIGAATQPLNLDIKHWFSQSMLEEWLNAGINFGLRVILVLVLFWLGKVVITRLKKIFNGILCRRNIEGVAVSLLDSVFTAILYIALFLFLAGVLGVKSVSFAAVLASMGLAVGMALSGQLQNLAGGVIIIVTKPFKLGDFISSQGTDGTVKAVRLFHTEVLTPDNKVVFIPNSTLSSSLVTNFSHEELRRVEWTIGIEYDEDYQRVRQVILALLQQDQRILTTPEPVIVLHKLNDSSVDILVRAWVASGDLWPVFWDFNERVYADFNAKGIGFPFPQLTVHQGK
ncbi:MAG: mechanosensitive ion channel [Porphyromonas sp.]|uniref:mechanosensitive ion channel family protein n=1 Tax=Porphyromonas sp. TaxID=1924944 RepID=UPI001CAF8094|nr:mechanosensitive ion channel domain-containing protein [Porphyromonas sp.]MBF1376085.1 mechanosensitive ion channel [Porphyromonas sp.]